MRPLRKVVTTKNRQTILAKREKVAKATVGMFESKKLQIDNIFVTGEACIDTGAAIA